MRMEKKEHKKRSFVVLGAALLCLAVLLGAAYWLLSGGRMKPVTGRISDEAYKEGRKEYYRREKYRPWNQGTITEMPELDENMGLDLRSCNASALDLSGEEEALRSVTFNTATIWPEQLPAGFSPKELLELGKDPGLGVRELHEMGLTGKGVSIAIVDQALNLEHNEYSDRLMSYELLHCMDEAAQMHGAAVASLAAGESCGVAPGAEIYYIASTFGTYGERGMDMDLNYMAQSIDRILEINALLPQEKKIRVISISRGFSSEKGADETKAAIERAKEAGVFVITTSTEENYDFALMGLGRDMTMPADDVNAYGPGSFWSDYFYSGETSFDVPMLLVPMDGRTFAEWTGRDDYEYESGGGLSWSVPWLAGMYALCVQAAPELTPETFIEKALATGTTRTISHEGKEYEFGVIINPKALVEEVRKDG